MIDPRASPGFLPTAVRESSKTDSIFLRIIAGSNRMRTRLQLWWLRGVAMERPARVDQAILRKASVKPGMLRYLPEVFARSRAVGGPLTAISSV